MLVLSGRRCTSYPPKLEDAQFSDALPDWPAREQTIFSSLRAHIVSLELVKAEECPPELGLSVRRCTSCPPKLKDGQFSHALPDRPADEQTVESSLRNDEVRIQLLGVKRGPPVLALSVKRCTSCVAKLEDGQFGDALPDQPADERTITSSLRNDSVSIPVLERQGSPPVLVMSVRRCTDSTKKLKRRVTWGCSAGPTRAVVVYHKFLAGLHSPHSVVTVQLDPSELAPTMRRCTRTLKKLEWSAAAYALPDRPAYRVAVSGLV